MTIRRGGIFFQGGGARSAAGEIICEEGFCYVCVDGTCYVVSHEEIAEAIANGGEHSNPLAASIAQRIMEIEAKRQAILEGYRATGNRSAAEVKELVEQRKLREAMEKVLDDPGILAEVAARFISGYIQQRYPLTSRLLSGAATVAAALPIGHDGESNDFDEDLFWLEVGMTPNGREVIEWLSFKEKYGGLEWRVTRFGYRVPWPWFLTSIGSGRIEDDKSWSIFLHEDLSEKEAAEEFVRVMTEKGYNGFGDYFTARDPDNLQHHRELLAKNAAQYTGEAAEQYLRAIGAFNAGFDLAFLAHDLEEDGLGTNSLISLVFWLFSV